MVCGIYINKTVIKKKNLGEWRQKSPTTTATKNSNDKTYSILKKYFISGKHFSFSM